MKNLKNLTLAIVAAASLVACDTSKKDEAQKMLMHSRIM